MSMESRLRRIEKQLGVALNINRRFLVVSGPPPEGEAEKAAHEAEIDRRIQKAIQRDPTKTFHLIWLLDPLCKDETNDG